MESIVLLKNDYATLPLACGASGGGRDGGAPSLFIVGDYGNTFAGSGSGRVNPPCVAGPATALQVGGEGGHRAGGYT